MTRTTKQLAPGRPPKFQEPCTTITITVPDRILALLGQVDSDRAKALVKCVEAAIEPASSSSVQLVTVSKNTCALLIGPCRSLEKIPWLHLVEVAPLRFLLAVPSGTDVAAMEVALIDLIESLPAELAHEKDMLVALRHQLTLHRRQDQLSKQEIFLLSNDLGATGRGQ